MFYPEKESYKPAVLRNGGIIHTERERGITYPAAVTRYSCCCRNTWLEAEESVMKAEPWDRIPRFSGVGVGTSRGGCCSSSTSAVWWVRCSDRAAFSAAGS